MDRSKKVLMENFDKKITSDNTAREKQKYDDKN